MDQIQKSIYCFNDTLMVLIVNKCSSRESAEVINHMKYPSAIYHLKIHSNHLVESCGQRQAHHWSRWRTFIPEKREKEKDTMENHGRQDFLTWQIEIKLSTQIFVGMSITNNLFCKWCIHNFMIYSIFGRVGRKNVAVF